MYPKKDGHMFRKTRRLRFEEILFLTQKIIGLVVQIAVMFIGHEIIENIKKIIK